MHKKWRRVFVLPLCLLAVFYFVFGTVPAVMASENDSFLLEFTDDETEQTRLVRVSPDAFAERAGNLKNPDRGLYHVKQFIITDELRGRDYWKADIDWFCQTAADADHTISLVEIDLKNYRNGRISDNGLADIGFILDVWRGSGRRIILRFVYDVDGDSTTYEPDSIETILLHMEQLGPYLREYKDCIFTMQGLFTGAWGEMHTTRFGSASDMRRLAVKLFEVTDPNTFLSVRMPAQLRAVTLDGSDGVLSSRMGLYNDGMLGSETDLGTYLESDCPVENGDGRWHRDEELSYQDVTCASVPNGGQVVVDNPYNDFGNAVRDMARMHVTYIDQYWQTSVLDKWKGVVLPEEYGAYAGKNGFDYITDHLGYRILVDDLDVAVKDSVSQTATVSVGFRNTGFAPMYTKPTVMLTVTDGSGSVVGTYEMAHDLTSLTGQAHPEQVAVATADVPMSVLADGSYGLYVQLQTLGGDSQPVPVRLANTQSYQDGLGYHVGNFCLSDGVYMPSETGRGVSIDYYVSGIADGAGPFTSVYRVDVLDVSGESVYSNVYTADVTENGRGRLSIPDISIPDNASVMVTCLYSGAGLKATDNRGSRPCVENNGWYSVLYEFIADGSARGYGVQNHFHLSALPSLVLPNTGGDGTHTVIGFSIGLVCLGIACMVLFGHNGRRRAMFGLLCLCMVGLPASYAFAEDGTYPTCEQAWTLAPGGSHSELDETVSGFTKTAHVTNLGPVPVSARVRAFSPDGFTVIAMENAVWSIGDDGWAYYRDELLSGDRSEDIVFSVRDANGEEIGQTFGEQDFNIVVVYEMDAKALPSPDVDVRIDNGEELTATVTFTMPDLSWLHDSVTADTKVILTYEGTTLALLDGVPSDMYAGRLVDAHGDLLSDGTATYTWVLDSLAADGNGGSARFKDLFDDPDLTFGNDFMVDASAELCAAEYSSGRGYAQAVDNSLYHTDTKGGPVAYVSNLRHLQNLDSATSSCSGQTSAVQTADIDAGTYKGEPYEFMPIVPCLSLGSYDGRNADVSHVIRNLTVTDTSSDGKSYAGLFSHVATFEFSDVTLDGVSVNAGNRHSGGLVGYLDWGTTRITDCNVTNATIRSDSCAGSIAGYGWSWSIGFERCSADDVTVVSTSNYVGGLFGGCGGGTVTFTDCTVGTDSHRAISVSGTHAGGLIGDAGSAATVTRCVVEDMNKAGFAVTGVSYAGGIAGNAVNGAMTDCRVENVSITGTSPYSEAGGIGGRVTGGSYVNCSSVGCAVSSHMNAGGILGGIASSDTDASISGCESLGVFVETNNFGGGLVGNSIGGSYVDCKAVSPHVVCSSATAGESGGLIGRAENVTVQRCKVYADGNVDVAPDISVADRSVLVKGVSSGGLVGTIRATATVTDSFAAVPVSGSMYVGGLIANLSAPDNVSQATNVTIERCYAHGVFRCPDAGGTVSYPLRIGGLIGLKSQGSKASLRDVYAAGKISMNPESYYFHAAGLISGTDYTSEDVRIQNAYAAIVYDVPADGYGGNCILGLAWAGMYTNCYYLDYGASDSSGRNLSSDGLKTVALGSSFVKSSNGYPFPVLSGLERFGDYGYLVSARSFSMDNVELSVSDMVEDEAAMRSSEVVPESHMETNFPEISTDVGVEVSSSESTGTEASTDTSSPDMAAEENVETSLPEPVTETSVDFLESGIENGG